MIPQESAFEGNASYIRPRVVQPADTDPWITSSQRLEDAIREARAQALEEAAHEARIRGDIGKDGGLESWDYLEWRAATERGQG